MKPFQDVLQGKHFTMTIPTADPVFTRETILAHLSLGKTLVCVYDHENIDDDHEVMIGFPLRAYLASGDDQIDLDRDVVIDLLPELYEVGQYWGGFVHYRMWPK